MQGVPDAAAVRVVDRALALSGGAGYLADHPLAKAWRDVRAGGFMHPVGANRAAGLLARTALGVAPDDRAGQPLTAAAQGVLDGGVAVERGALGERRLVGRVAEHLPAGARRARRGAASSAPKMRCPACVARTAPTSTAASRGARAGPAARRSSAASSTASTTSRHAASG